MTTTAPALWKDSDFRDIFNALATCRTIFQDCPQDAADLASVALMDIDAAVEAARRIAEAVCADLSR